MFDAIIVGSGPAGTSAALALRGTHVLVLDVGYTAPGTPAIEGNIYQVRSQREDLFHELIGERFEGLRNIAGRKISLKLKSPYTSYVIRDWEQLCPLVSGNFDGVVSFAQGGLANAWGAGVYRFNDRELSEFPITAADLAPFFDELTAHIGISGTNDELVAYFGSDAGLLPPIRISAVAREILGAYESRRSFFHARGIRMGLPRLAVLTQPHNGRPAYTYDNLEFFKPYNPAIYNPVFTLDELVAGGAVEFRRGYLVTRFEDRGSHVEVTARKLAAGQEEVFRARKLLLAAGTLSTTKIVLAARGDTTSRLPILDNPMCCIPLIRLARVGSALEVNDSSLAQLNVICEDDALSGARAGQRLRDHGAPAIRCPVRVSAGCFGGPGLGPVPATRHGADDVVLPRQARSEELHPAAAGRGTRGELRVADAGDRRAEADRRIPADGLPQLDEALPVP